MFSARGAKRSKRRYLRKGLSGTELDLADAVAATGIEGATVLDVGGGVGTLAADLLRRGGSSATVVDLSPTWDGPAAELAETLGLGDRIERRAGDFVEIADQIEPADVVVAHAVICCYPEWRQLLSAMIAKGRRVLGITLPADRWGSRLFIRVTNAGLAVLRRNFRTFVHPVAEIVEEARAAGFEEVSGRTGAFWHTFVMQR